MPLDIMSAKPSVPKPTMKQSLEVSLSQVDDSLSSATVTISSIRCSSGRRWHVRSWRSVPCHRVSHFSTSLRSWLLSAMLTVALMGPGALLGPGMWLGAYLVPGNAGYFAQGAFTRGVGGFRGGRNCGALGGGRLHWGPGGVPREGLLG